MHELLYFFHLLALALWFCSLLAAAWWSRSALRAPDAGTRGWALQLVNRLTARVAVPASLLVLLAGLSMSALAGQGGAPRPLWFKVMEQGGALLVLASLFLVPWLGRRVKAAAADRASLQRTVGVYAGGLVTLAAGVAGVLLAVSLRLA